MVVEVTVVDQVGKVCEGRSEGSVAGEEGGRVVVGGVLGDSECYSQYEELASFA